MPGMSPRGDGGFALDKAAGVFEFAGAAPAEAQLAVLEAGLRDAVAADDKAVAGVDVELVALDRPVGPAGRDDGLVNGRGDVIESAQLDVARVAHLGEARAAADLQVNHGEGGVGDAADGVHGEGVLDRLDAAHEVHVRAQEAHGHGDGHLGEDGGLDPRAKAVGEDGEGAVLGVDALDGARVAARDLPVLADLRVLHLDEVVRRGGACRGAAHRMPFPASNRAAAAAAAASSSPSGAGLSEP